MKNQRLQIGIVIVAVAFILILSVVRFFGRNQHVEDTFYATETPSLYTLKNQRQATQSAVMMDESATLQAIYYQVELQMNPQDANTYYYRAMNHMYKDNYWQAILDLDRAIQLGNSNLDLSTLYAERADAYSELGMYQLAIDDYTRAIKLTPLSYLYYYRAYVYYDMGEYEKAITDFDHVLSLSPDDEYTYRGRGRSYEGLGNTIQAIADFTRAIEINPDYTQAYINRGNVYVDLRQYTSARADYDKAIEIDPQNEVAFLNIGVIYDHLDDDESAYVYYNLALEIDPEYEFAYLYRGKKLYQFGNYDRAIADWTIYERLTGELLPSEYDILRQDAYDKLGQ